MKSALVIYDSDKAQLHCIYDNTQRIIKISDSKCKTYIDTLSKNYSIQIALMSTKNINFIKEEIDKKQNQIKKTIQEKELQVKHTQNMETSTLYRSVCKGPLVLSDMAYTLLPGQYLNLSSLSKEQAKSMDLKRAINNKFLVKTTIMEINKIAEQNQKKEEKLLTQSSPIINTSVKDFIDGGADPDTIDITSEISKISDRDVNDPNKSMSALMQELDKVEQK